MSHKISNNLAGALGEIFIVNFFSEFKLKDAWHIYRNIKIPVKELKKKKDYIAGFGVADKYVTKKLLQLFGTTTLPDFLVDGTNSFIEVKTGKYAELEKEQRKEFKKILNLNYRIFVVKPVLSIEKLKFELKEIKCQELYANNRRKTLSVKKLKKSLKQQIETGNQV